jgi:hypothetical protein
MSGGKREGTNSRVTTARAAGGLFVNITDILRKNTIFIQREA